MSALAFWLFGRDSGGVLAGPLFLHLNIGIRNDLFVWRAASFDNNLSASLYSSSQAVEYSVKVEAIFIRFVDRKNMFW